MTPAPGPRKSGLVLLAATSAAMFWIGWVLGLIPQGTVLATLGAGLIAAPLLLLLEDDRRSFQGLAGTLLGLCPTGGLLLTLTRAPDLASVAGRLGLWPLGLSLFAALLALSLMPGLATRSALVRGGLVLAALLTFLQIVGAGDLGDRWVLASSVHMLIAYVACLVLATQARNAILGPPGADLARMTQGMTQLLPILGFAGTVWGIMLALGALPAIFASDTVATEPLQDLLGGLATAFETTLLGLVASVVVAVLDMLLPDPDPGP